MLLTVHFLLLTATIFIISIFKMEIMMRNIAAFGGNDENYSSLLFC